MTSFQTLRQVFLLLCLLLLLSACSRGVKLEKPPDPVAPVKWEEPRRVALEEWTELVGTTQPLPDHAARLTAPIAGVVMSVLPAQKSNAQKPIAEGQMVQKGDIIAQLDATAVQANLAKAQAAKKVLEADQEVAAFAVKQAALELKRLEELAKQQDSRSSNQLQLVSPVMVEKARLALESAHASLRAGERKLEGADKEEAALDLEIQLFTLKAPRAGRLGRLQAVIGQTLPAGAPIAEVIDIDDDIDVLCFVAASEARKLQLGQAAYVGGLDKSNQTAAGPEGKIVYIADQAEAESGLFAVKVRFPNTALKLRASSVARIRVLTTPSKSCWAIPESALQEDTDPPTIVVVEEVKIKKNADGKEEQSGKARRLRVQTGMRDRLKNQVEILRFDDPEKKWRGAMEDTPVVVEKGQSLQTGDEVKLEVEEEEEAPKEKEKE